MHVKYYNYLEAAKGDQLNIQFLNTIFHKNNLLEIARERCTNQLNKSFESDNQTIDYSALSDFMFFALNFGAREEITKFYLKNHIIVNFIKNNSKQFKEVIQKYNLNLLLYLADKKESENAFNKLYNLYLEICDVNNPTVYPIFYCAFLDNDDKIKIGNGTQYVNFYLAKTINTLLNKKKIKKTSNDIQILKWYNIIK